MPNALRVGAPVYATVNLDDLIDFDSCGELRSGVYIIYNVRSKKVYIGSTVKSIRSRLFRHRASLNRGKHPNQHLQSSWNVDKETSFKVGVVVICGKEECLFLEQKYIDLYRSSNRDLGYNLSPTAGNTLGCKHTEETKKLIRNKRSNKPLSEETRNRISRSKKGKKFTKDHKSKISTSLKGRKVSEEDRKRLKQLRADQILKGVNVGVPVGFKHSEESKQKIREATKGVYKSEEAKKNMSEAAKLRWARLRSTKS